MRGYPVGTIAFYGPDSRRATKAVGSIVVAPESEPAELRRWFAETGDARADDMILAELAAFFREREVHSVVSVDRIIGCPHEEGIDYPVDGNCPHCPYWAGRDRWTGRLDAN